MKRFLLSSCATGLVFAVVAGNSALAQTFTVPPSTPQTVSTPITDNGTSPNSVAVTGGGTLILDGVNSYTGGTAVTGNSTVQVGTESNLGAVKGALSLGDATTGGTLATNSASFVSNRAITLNVGGGTLNAAGYATLNGPISGGGGLIVNGGTVELTGANSYAGSTSVINNSQLVVHSDANLGAPTFVIAGVTYASNINLGDTASAGSGTLTIAPGVTNFSTGRTVNLDQGGGIINGVTTPGGVATFAGAVTGGGALSINAGTVALTNLNNNYTGGTVVQGGATLQVTDDLVLGGSGFTPVTLGDNGAVDANGKQTAAPQGGTLQWINTQAQTSARSIVLENGGGTLLVNPSSSVTLTSSIVNNGDPTSKASLTVGGGGTLILSSVNTFQGDLHLLQNTTLNINQDNELGGYTSNQNLTTGQITNTATNFAADGVTPILNTVRIDGGTLQFAANTTVLHPIVLTDGADPVHPTSTFDTNGNSAIVSGVISGTGGLDKVGTGVLTLEATNTYTGETTVRQGALVIGDAANPSASVAGDVTVKQGAGLGGSGSIGGMLKNDGGTVAPANTLTAGNYIQGNGATLAPEITPTTTATSSSELKVTGIAAINGGALTVGYAPGFLRAGQYQIFTANAIAGTGFSSVDSGIVPSAGLTAQVEQIGNSYYVVLTQKADLPDHPNVLPSLTAAALDQAQQTTGALLDRLATARSNALADELAVAMTDTHRVRGTSPYGLWVQPMGGTGSQDAAGGIAGYSTQTEGFLMGVDTEWTPGVSIGVALGYSHLSLSEDGGATGTAAEPLLAIYGGWWNGPFAVDGLVGITMGEIDAKRPVNLPLAGTTTPVAQVASSARNANEKMAALQASGSWAFDGWVVGPQLGAKYVNLRQTSFTETGTDIYNFTVESNTINSLRPFISGDVTKRFFISDHWALVPSVKVGFEHEVNRDAAHITAQTQGDAQLWVFNGLLPGANIVRFLGGLKLELNRSEAFYVNYDRQQSNTGQSQLIQGGFRYRL